MRNLLANRPDLQAEALRRTVATMNDAIDDCLVEKFGFMVDSLTLPDPDDRHVLAVAIVGHADAIVTFNLRDFPEKDTAAYGIEILHPDDFLVAQYDLTPISVLKTIKSARARLRNPPKTAVELIVTYEAQGLPLMGKILRDAAELI